VQADNVRDEPRKQRRAADGPERFRTGQPRPQARASTAADEHGLHNRATFSGGVSYLSMLFTVIHRACLGESFSDTWHVLANVGGAAGAGENGGDHRH
jgi:hypothetical protein